MDNSKKWMLIVLMSCCSLFLSIKIIRERVTIRFVNEHMQPVGWFYKPSKNYSDNGLGIFGNRMYEVKGFISLMMPSYNSTTTKITLPSISINITIGLSQNEFTNLTMAPPHTPDRMKNLNTFYNSYMKTCEDSSQQKKQNICACFPKSLIGWENPDNIMKMFQSPANVEYIQLPDGSWTPKSCEARHHVAIIIPYRNRPSQLKIFISRMNAVLQRQQIHYKIFVIEQNEPKTFSRAVLMNVGYLIAKDNSGFDCYIFTDVDLMPEDDRLMYNCLYSPVHIGAYVNKFKYKVLYPSIFGGTSAMSEKHVLATNLFSNHFYGWGGEDDDLSHRLKAAGLKMYRYPAEVGRIYMITHQREKSNDFNPVRSSASKMASLQTYLKDGVNQTRYKNNKNTTANTVNVHNIDLLPHIPPDNCRKKGTSGGDNTFVKGSAVDTFLHCWGDSFFKSGKVFCCPTRTGPECCRNRNR